MAYHRTHGLDMRIVRIFNTYGPRMRPDDGRVVSNFIVQALQGEPLTVYGDGTPDPQLLLRRRRGARASWPCSTATATGPINIGNPDEFTMLELAEIVLEVTGVELARSCTEPLPVDDPTQRQPDITLAREPARLGARRSTLREGIDPHRRVLPRAARTRPGSDR